VVDRWWAPKTYCRVGGTVEDSAVAGSHLARRCEQELAGVVLKVEAVGVHLRKWWILVQVEPEGAVRSSRCFLSMALRWLGLTQTEASLLEPSSTAAVDVQVLGE
jgi:hypothetical protein